MVFSSLLFLFGFLPCILLGYFIVPAKGKNFFLFLASLIFYAWGEPVYVVIMLASTILDYICGRGAGKYQGTRKAVVFLICSVVFNIGILAFFKYSGFFVEIVNSVGGLNWNIPGLELPIGISFYTFQTMSYTIDVYRGRVAAQKNIITLGAYVALFPQLIAGPIVRYKTIEEQLIKRSVTLEQFSNGVMRFIRGLGKKVLLANTIGMLWESALVKSGELSVVGAWIGVFAFAMQIYFDFSGYSDMAIGLGNMFGFTFPENFREPYRSNSISDFWRRWHITLGEWFRDYVYFPLGGSRCSKPKIVRNLTIVWLLTGLWHGADWNFVLWGCYFGFWIIMEKLWLGKSLVKIQEKRGSGWIAHAYALLIVAVGWIIFAIPDLATMGDYLKNMFSGNWIDSWTIYQLRNYGVLIIVLLLIQLPIKEWIANKKIVQKGKFAGYVLVFLFSVAFLVNAAYNPFLYFRF